MSYSKFEMDKRRRQCEVGGWPQYQVGPVITYKLYLDTGLLGPEEYIFFDYDFVDHRFPNDIAIQCLTQEMHDRGPGQPLMLREICRAVMHDDKRSGEVGRLEVPQDLWDDATVSQLDEIALLAMVQIYRLARGWSSSVRREGGDGGGGGDSNVFSIMAGTAAVVADF